jgi:MerR family transcriptional regulator, light-induced transcriptional regulator
VVRVHDGGPKPGYLRIGELSRRSGVSPELLRAWEERYALLSPARTAGGFRLYDEHDEQRVQLMLRYLSGGIAAAHAAHLALAEPLTAMAAAPPASAGSRALDGELARALDRFDEGAAHAALDRIFSAYGLEIALRDVLVPYLHELGQRWQRGSVSVAQEHFATALIRGRLLALARGWGAGAGPLALLACVPEELHDLGLICFGLALRGHGWRITFLGAATPTETVAETARIIEPALIVLAASSSVEVVRSTASLAEIAREAPLALGGRGTNAAIARAVGARYLPDDPVTAAARVAARFDVSRESS